MTPPTPPPYIIYDICCRFDVARKTTDAEPRADVPQGLSDQPPPDVEEEPNTPSVRGVFVFPEYLSYLRVLEHHHAKRQKHDISYR